VWGEHGRHAYPESRKDSGEQSPFGAGIRQSSAPPPTPAASSAINRFGASNAASANGSSAHAVPSNAMAIAHQATASAGSRAAALFGADAAALRFVSFRVRP
jgi:hypothetical protein